VHKRLVSLHSVILDAFEAFGHRVWHHPANTRVDIDGFALHSLGSVGPAMVRDPVALVAINAPDCNREAYHLFGYVARGFPGPH
jgi:hypothetical protein